MDASLLDYLQSLLTAERLTRMEEVLAERTRHVSVVLENLHRTQNASACLRNCEAFGVQDVHLIPSASGFRVNRDIAQGAAGWLTLRQHDGHLDGGVSQCFRSLKGSGYRIVAISNRGASGWLSDYEPLAKTALVFGNERDGLSDSALEHADEVRCLPMFGFTESFNLSVAVALSLGELLPRVRRDAIPWRLSEQEQQSLRETWVRKSLGYRLQQIERDYHRRQES